MEKPHKNRTPFENHFKIERHPLENHLEVFSKYDHLVALVVGLGHLRLEQILEEEDVSIHVSWL